MRLHINRKSLQATSAFHSADPLNEVQSMLNECVGLKSSVDKQSLEINGAMPTSVSILQLTQSLHV
jgi:hypothetical protein